jgi:hypothetical protein
MKYVDVTEEVIKGRLSNAVKPNERTRLEEQIKLIFKFIRDINRLEGLMDENEAAVKTKSGTILSVKQLADFELPSVFKPLLMPKSVRITNNHRPQHPDLKDYKSLGNGIQIIEAEIGEIKEVCDMIIATLGRNHIVVGNCKVNDVWKDQTLVDVFNNCSLKTSSNVGKANVVESSFTSVPVPLKDISLLVSEFYFGTGVSEWAELFRQVYKI